MKVKEILQLNKNQSNCLELGPIKDFFLQEEYLSLILFKMSDACVIKMRLTFGKVVTVYKFSKHDSYPLMGLLRLAWAEGYKILHTAEVAVLTRIY